MAVAKGFKIPLTNRPYFEWPVLRRLERTDTGYDAIYETQRVRIKGLPEMRSMGLRDIALYAGFLLAQQPPDEDDDEEESLHEGLQRLKSLQAGQK